MDSSRTSPSGSNSREEELAGILRGKEKPPGGNWSEHYTSDLYSSSLLLSDGTKFAEVLRTRLSIPRWDRIVDTFWIKKDSEKKNSVLDPGVEKWWCFENGDTVETHIQVMGPYADLYINPVRQRFPCQAARPWL